MVEMSDVAADAVRSHVEELWSEADLLARGLSEFDLTAETVEASEDPGLLSWAGWSQNRAVASDTKVATSGTGRARRPSTALVGPRPTNRSCSKPTRCPSGPNRHYSDAAPAGIRSWATSTACSCASSIARRAARRSSLMTARSNRSGAPLSRPIDPSVQSS